MKKKKNGIFKWVAGKVKRTAKKAVKGAIKIMSRQVIRIFMKKVVKGAIKEYKKNTDTYNRIAVSLVSSALTTKKHVSRKKITKKIGVKDMLSSCTMGHQVIFTYRAFFC